MSTRALRRGDIARSGALAPSTVNVLSLPGTAGNYVSTPDSAANSITGDIDVRAKISQPDWTPASAGYALTKYEGAGGNLSFALQPRSTGALRLWVSTTGSNVISLISDAVTGFTDGTAHWIRATRVAATGAVTFYTSEDGSSWASLGTVQSGTAGNIFNSTAAVAIGAGNNGTESPFLGNIYYVELRNGIDGTVVQSFDATAVTKIGTRDPSSVAVGGPWTINGTAWDWVAV